MFPPETEYFANIDNAHVRRADRNDPTEFMSFTGIRRGLRSVHSHYGLHTRWITRGDPLDRRLQPLRYLHDCSDYFRLEHFAGWDLHPLEGAAFSRRTPSGDRLRS